MTTPDPAEGLSFRDLVFSDLRRYRPNEQGSWLRVLARLPFIPGLIASLIVRAQQCLHRAGHAKLAGLLRTVSTLLLSADFGPGMRIGPGFQLVHPIGVNIGYGLTIGADVTFAGGVTAAARDYDATGPQEFATIEDGAISAPTRCSSGRCASGAGRSSARTASCCRTSPTTRWSSASPPAGSAPAPALPNPPPDGRPARPPSTLHSPWLLTRPAERR